MPNKLTDTSVRGISNTLSSIIADTSDTSTLTNIETSVGLAIADPIGVLIKKSLVSINNITSLITNRIKKLEEDIINSVDNTGKVELINDQIIIVLSSKDASLAPIFKQKIEKDINSINTSLATMQGLVKTFRIISKTANTLKTLLNIQEALLSANPVSKATLSVFKKAIKIISYKDILNDYIRIINEQVTKNENVLNGLIQTMTRLNVQFTIDNQSSQGNNLTDDQALNLIANNSLLGPSNQGNTQTYKTQSGNTYLLKVEAYGVGQLIARAIDSYSGLIKVETAPSYIETPEQLISELKTIIGD